MSVSVPPLAATINVALGGAIGAALRYHVSRLGSTWSGPGAAGVFPWATLAVNVIGSLAMGLLAGWLLARLPHEGEPLRLLLGVGVLGGFTTFSAFSLELVQMMQRGHLPLALLYAVLSVAMAVAALAAGLAMARAAA